MSIVEHDFLTEELHPIDIVETLAERHEWDFDRVAEDQIAMAIEGDWRTYSLTLAWSGHDETLRLICAFDMEPPEARLPALTATMERANDRCWAGAFTLWPEQKLMVWRYGLILAGGATASAEQIVEMVRVAVTTSERFFPAFQMVCWGDETPQKAMQIAMTEAYGRA
ncbi:diacylglyceryl transferase [Rhodobacteraceae bacterium 2CG4]|uniref:Diacylglyceryl transferase n=1 Tax=Halovulum marinum TaxID=2662447 RepID=A0A6L5YZI6_9RHOB|nr:YbjN domain-containing protein [Halovulum marinum]MSU89693.1 diacylglyceryl transferase [Halovulum marinum]